MLDQLKRIVGADAVLSAKGERAVYEKDAYPLEAATPQWTAYDEWRVTIGKQPRPEPDPVLVKKVATAT